MEQKMDIFYSIVIFLNNHYIVPTQVYKLNELLDELVNILLQANQFLILIITKLCHYLKIQLYFLHLDYNGSIQLYLNIPENILHFNYFIICFHLSTYTFWRSKNCQKLPSYIDSPLLFLPFTHLQKRIPKFLFNSRVIPSKVCPKSDIPSS